MKTSFLDKLKTKPLVIGIYVTYFFIIFIPQSIDWYNADANDFTKISVPTVFFVTLFVINIVVSVLFGILLIVKGVRGKKRATIVGGVFLVGSVIIVSILFLIYSIIMIAIAGSGLS